MRTGAVATALVVVLALAACAAAEWQVVAPEILTIAIGVAAPTTTSVYVTGSANGDTGKILYSANSGADWVEQSHDLQLMYLSLDMDGTTGVAGALGFFGQTAAGSITTDGQTWTGAGEQVKFSSAQSCAAVNGTAFFVGYFLPTYVETYDGVAYTTNGGRTLNIVNWNQGTNARYGAFPNPNTWVVSGGTWPTSEGSFMTRSRYLSERVDFHMDHGLKKNIEVRLRDRAPVARDTKQAGYIGVIAISRDQGQTWTRVFTDEGRFYFNGIHCQGPRYCWAVAEGDAGGWIFGTTDGGVTWTEQHFVEGAGLFQVEFSDEQHGWAVGAIIGTQNFSALFLRTFDGGRTWTQTSSIPSAFPNDVTVPSRGAAYATAFLRNGLSSVLAFKE